MMSRFNKASQQVLLPEYESNPGIRRREMEWLHLSVVQMDVKVMATVSWPRSVSILYTFRLCDRARLKSRSPWTPQLAFY